MSNALNSFFRARFWFYLDVVGTNLTYAIALTKAEDPRLDLLLHIKDDVNRAKAAFAEGPSNELA